MELTEALRKSVQDELQKMKREGELSDDELDIVCGGRNTTMQEDMVYNFNLGIADALYDAGNHEKANKYYQALANWLKLPEGTPDFLYNRDEWLAKLDNNG